jgi:hypothetical protein
MHRRLALVLALAGCGKAEDRPELEQPTDENRADYRAISSRVERFVDAHGYVIARDAAGNEKHQGDGLWRSGIALANLPCDMGLGIERALQDMTRSLGGALWRHPTQPERMSLDQALGFYYGAAARVTRCPETAAAWREALALHKDYLEANDGQLNPVDGAKLTAPFTAVRDALFSAVNLADGPSGRELASLEATAAAWTLATKTAKAACFRVNLSWMSLRTVEYAGYSVSDFGRNQFCGAAEGTDLPQVEHYCGRDGLDAFNREWQPNVWDFRFQRCAGWEEPDCIGDECAGVDKLTGLVEQYDFSNVNL